MSRPAHRSLHLLGRFAAGVAGKEPLEIKIRTKKGAALLAFLAVHPHHGADREELAALLWGDRSDLQARQDLRQCLISLRTDLAPFAPDLLVFEGDRIGLLTESLSVDAIELAELAKSDQLSELERACRLYRGRFLADCTIDLEPFAEWLRSERARFESIAANVFEACTDRYDALGNADKAIAAARRLVALDPLREDWQRRLLRLYARYQSPEVAAAHARSLAALLRKELDADPAPATKALLTDIGRARMAASEPPRGATIADYGRSKPSLAVLPFVIMPADEALAGVTKGITEDVVAALARSKSFSVIAPNRSSGDADELTRIASELGVRYLLAGGARRADNQIRLTVRLVDALTGIHIWAHSYTHELRAGFASLDAVTSNIAALIEPHIYAAEENRLRRTPLDALDAAGCVIRALSAAKTRSQQDCAVAQGLLNRAIELDPTCARAHSFSAFFTGLEVLYGWKSRQNALALGLDAAQKAVLLDDHDPCAHFALGWTLTQNRVPEGGIEEYQRALAINPYFPLAQCCLALALGYVGRIEKALTVLENGERLGVPETFIWLNNTARAGIYFCGERLGDALTAARRSVQQRPGSIGSRRHLVVTCALAGEIEEARAAFKTFVRSMPDLSPSSIASALPYVRDDDLDRTLEAFRLMGVR